MGMCSKESFRRLWKIIFIRKLKYTQTFEKQRDTMHYLQVKSDFMATLAVTA